MLEISGVARLTGHWNNGYFTAVLLYRSWNFIVALLFVKLYFYIFSQHQFGAGRTIKSSPEASPARQTVKKLRYFLDYYEYLVENDSGLSNSD